MRWDDPTRRVTRCPVGACSYGDGESKALPEVAAHVRRTDDAAHDQAGRQMDWSYEYRQIE